MASQVKHERRTYQNKKKILLVACGSFNPVTNMHLRMFEVARDALEQIHPCQIVGVISPVNDKYSHKELAPAANRIEMVKLALVTSTWIKVDPWEANQDCWLETVKILRHMKEVSDSYFSTGEENDNELTHSSKKRRVHDVNKNVEHLDGSVAVPSGDVEVRLLCGADVIQSFAVPDLWKSSHIEEIVKDFGIVVCNRVGYDLNKLIYEFDVLTAYKNNILVITDWITNEISSTKIRRALKRGESVKYLLQDSVIDYIHHKQLYNAKITK